MKGEGPLVVPLLFGKISYIWPKVDHRWPKIKHKEFVWPRGAHPRSPLDPLEPQFRPNCMATFSEWPADQDTYSGKEAQDHHTGALWTKKRFERPIEGNQMTTKQRRERTLDLLELQVRPNCRPLSPPDQQIQETNCNQTITWTTQGEQRWPPNKDVLFSWVERTLDPLQFKVKPNCMALSPPHQTARDFVELGFQQSAAHSRVNREPVWLPPPLGVLIEVKDQQKATIQLQCGKFSPLPVKPFRFKLGCFFFQNTGCVRLIRILLIRISG